MAANPEPNGAVPSSVAAAVLVQSDEMPAGSQKVEELDFNNFAGRPITVDDLMSGMNNMGFQATSIGDAVRIINDMVLTCLHPHPPPLTNLVVASMARPRNLLQNYHLPRLHQQPDLVWPARDAALPRTTQAHLGDRHDGRRRRGRLHQMPGRHIHGVVQHARRRAA